MTTGITGNPAYDLLIVGALGGAVIGAMVFGGILKKLYMTFIEAIYPVIVIREVPLADKKTKMERDYGRKTFSKNKDLYLVRWNQTKSDPLKNSDFQKIGNREYLFCYEDRPGHIVPVEKVLGTLETATSPDGAEQTMVKELFEPKIRDDAEIFRRESNNDWVHTERYKKKEDAWWMKPVLVNYIGAGIIVFCLLVGMGIGAPKVFDAARAYSGGLVNQGVDAGIRAGVETGMKYCGFKVNSTVNLTTVNLPGDYLSNMAQKFGGG